LKKSFQPFIVIDGLDASGKSTQALKLYNFLKNHGKTVYLRFHPSNDNFFGVKAKQFLYLKGKGAHFAAAFFYMLDVIRSIMLYSWRGYDYVIFVRYLMGTAYLPSPFHKIAYHFFASLVPTSDLMFFLDVNPEEALSLALIGNWTVIDANKSIEDIEKGIRKSL